MAETPKARPIRVVFLLFYYEAWDSLASIFETMRRDDRFEPIVATIPRKLTGDAGYGNERDVHEFLASQDVPHIRLRDTNYDKELERLKRLEPDYVFLNYPWQRNYPPAFRIDRLVSFTRVAYVPYFLLPLVNEVPAVHEAPKEQPASNGDATAVAITPPVAEHLFEQRTHQLASLIFCQDQATRDAFALTERGNEYVFVTGSPKLDALRANASKVAAKLARKAEKRAQRGARAAKYDLRVLWAPHHSYSPAWLNFGMFKESYREMLAFAANNPRIKVTLRPHPFLFGTLTDRDVVDSEQLENWLQSFDSLPNTKISNKAQFTKQFMKSDVLLTDGISFLAEYPLLTGKPAIFLENPNHWSFNRVGRIAADCNIHVSSVAEFESIALAIAANKASLPDYSEEIAKLREVADPNPGKTATVVCDIVAADFDAGTKLINPSSLKTLAWENRPGREPQAD